MPVCNACLLDKPEMEFHLNSNGKPRKQCYKCHKARYYSYVKKPPEYWEEKRAEAIANKAVAKSMRALVRVLQLAATEDERRNHAKAIKRKERKLYRLRTPLEKIVRRHNWKCSKAGIAGRITIAGLKSIVERQQSMCACCGVEVAQGVNMHIDHIVPKSKGGENVDSNLQVLCNKCNMRKGMKLPNEFANTQTRKTMLGYQA